MITGLGEAPNIRFALQAPGELTRGKGWAWGDIIGAEDIGREYVTSLAELISAIRVWGTYAAKLMICHAMDTFNVCAYDVSSGHIRGRDTWFRSAETGLLIPHGEPFCLWPRETTLAA